MISSDELRQITVATLGAGPENTLLLHLNSVLLLIMEICRKCASALGAVQSRIISILSTEGGSLFLSRMLHDKPTESQTAPCRIYMNIYSTV